MALLIDAPDTFGGISLSSIQGLVLAGYDFLEGHESNSNLLFLAMSKSSGRSVVLVLFAPSVVVLILMDLVVE